MNIKLLGGMGAGIIIAIAVAAFAIPSDNPPDVTPVAITQNENLGLVINTPNTSTSLQELNSIYEQAASAGIGRSNVYLFWNLIEPVKDEYYWDQPDVLMSFNKKNNLKVTLFFSVINGKTLGPFPDWIGKPPLKEIPEEHLIDVLDAILSRYDIVDTVIISGETDSHFRYNEQSIPLYKEMFSNVYDALKEKHPDVKIGNIFSLNGIINKNLQHIPQELDIGDFMAFSYLPVNALNDIVKTPSDARSDLETVFDLAGDKKIALFEVGWSTSDFVGGNVTNQQEFVSEVYDFYNDNEEKIEFVTWYRQYDRPHGTCAVEPDEIEGSVSIGGGSGLGSSEFVIERLGHYVCSSGLINNTENPKPAWNEFKNKISSLT